MNDITACFAFLKYCLGYKGDMSRVIAGMNWQELYSFASKQALLGLCFDGIERLGKEYPEELKQNPIGRELLMTWMGKAQQIRRQNMKVNAVAGKLFAMLREDGMRQIIDYYHVVCDFYKVYQNSSKITPTLSPSGKREETAPPRRSEPLRSKVGGPKRSSPDCTGWDRLGIAVYSLQLIVYSLRLISWLFADNLQISFDFLGGFEEIA